MTFSYKFLLVLFFAVSCNFMIMNANASATNEQQEETLQQCKVKLNESVVKMTIYEDELKEETDEKEKQINKVKQLQQDLEQSELNLLEVMKQFQLGNENLKLNFQTETNQNEQLVTELNLNPRNVKQGISKSNTENPHRETIKNLWKSFLHVMVELEEERVQAKGKKILRENLEQNLEVKNKQIEKLEYEKVRMKKEMTDLREQLEKSLC